MLEILTNQLLTSQSLAEDQVSSAVEELVRESVDVNPKAEFLTALARKGETPEEITAFARELRTRCLRPALDAEQRSREILDVVGTGGDRLSTFNISTTVALLAAAAGLSRGPRKLKIVGWPRCAHSFLAGMICRKAGWYRGAKK